MSHASKLQQFFAKNTAGILLCLAIAIPAWFLGKTVPVVGGPVFSILIGMIVTLFLKKRIVLKAASPLFPRKCFSARWFFWDSASVVTTIVSAAGISTDIFTPLKTLSKFFIVLAIAAIGLNTNIIKLIRTGAKPLLLGFCCWVGITGVSLLLQHAMQLW